MTTCWSQILSIQHWSTRGDVYRCAYVSFCVCGCVSLCWIMFVNICWRFRVCLGIRLWVWMRNCVCVHVVGWVFVCLFCVCASLTPHIPRWPPPADLPVCVSGSQTVAVAEGEDVRLSCRVDAQPDDDLRFIWYFNNTLDTIEVERHRVQVRQGHSFLDYTPR